MVGFYLILSSTKCPLLFIHIFFKHFVSVKINVGAYHSNFSILSVPDKGYSRYVSCTLNLILLQFYYIHVLN
jgi:hypothetical protein